MLQHGQIPTDGFLESTTASGVTRKLRPYSANGIAMVNGQRLSGTVTIGLHRYAPDTITYRLLVDGVAQPTHTIDTTQWMDGSHVLAFQVLDSDGLSVHNGSRVVIFNNSGVAFTDLDGQAVVMETKHGSQPNSLCWGRVDVQEPIAYPLAPQLSKHPIAVSDTDRQRLKNETVWWKEGYSHQPTMLWSNTPMLFKNKDGDYYVGQFNPQLLSKSADTFPRLGAAPAYDGPRGVHTLSPYTTLTPDPYHILPSGETGWIGVDLSGRVVRLDIDGTVETILGPRSVAGVVGTDFKAYDFDLQDRIAAGEKEYVGDVNGQMPENVQDLWVCDMFPFEGVMASTGTGEVVEIHFGNKPDAPEETPHLMRRWPLTEVSSVCASLELQRDYDMIWVAVNPDGLWCQRHTFDANGIMTGHQVNLELFASIPNAFWVRVNRERIFVLTLDLGIYEVNASTGAITNIKERETYDSSFVFASVDINGSIGPVGDIYWGTVSGANGGWYKTRISRTNPDTKVTEPAGLSCLNSKYYGSLTASTDFGGHYMWGFAQHATRPMFLVCGITSSSWFLWSGMLGDLPEEDPAIPYEGFKEFKEGKLDNYLGLGSVFGSHGSGMIGYACDKWRDYKLWTDAKPVMMADLEPFWPANMPQIDRENVARMMFYQRTRPHFMSTTPPDPEPLAIGTLNAGTPTIQVSVGAASGGAPPYSYQLKINNENYGSPQTSTIWTLDYVAADVYQVVVTDSEGNTAEAS
jgi:hypothetical protein